MRTIYHVLIALICVTTLSACGDNAVAVGPTPLPPEVVPVPEPEPEPEPPEPEPPEPPVTVTTAIAGTVFHNQLDKPLADVLVEVLNTNPAIQTKTNANGYFRLEGIQTAQFVVRFSTSRCDTADRTFTFELGKGDLNLRVVMDKCRVFWSDLPPISQEAKDYIIRANFHNPDFDTGAATRWTRFPIPVYADPWFNRQNLADALNIWTQAANGKLSFRVVETREEAATYGIVLNNPPRRPLPDRSCGPVYIDQVENNVILRVTAEVRAGGGCRDVSRADIARGIGLAIGLDYAPPGHEGVMSTPAVWNMPPLLSESATWLYSVPPAIRPE